MGRSTGRKRKRGLHPVAGVLLAIIVCIGMLACGASNCGPDQEFAGSGMTITLLDVGQGLSVLMEADGRYMLYDGGGRDSSSYVVAYLKEHGCRQLDLMVASHYDADHIAGLIGCLYNYPVDTLWCPDYQRDTKIYESFIKARKDAGVKVVNPSAGDIYSLGCGQLEVLSAQDYDDSNENNASIVLKITYGSFSCIITGDAEWELEKELAASRQDLKTDVYVVGHHGSASSSNRSFVAAMSPKAALISCGADNDYGHPADNTLQILEDCGAAVYRTDMQGEIICTTDGRGYTMNVEAYGYGR